MLNFLLWKKRLKKKEKKKQRNFPRKTIKTASTAGFIDAKASKLYHL